MAGKRRDSFRDWEAAHSAITTRVVQHTQAALRSYEALPALITEHANLELAVAQGGYGERQIYELVQNGADAMIGGDGGEIQVILTEDALYCANEGEAVDEHGVGALLGAYMSAKRRDEIGRFGLGFKSVLAITAKPHFFSRSGSFGFDSQKFKAQLSQIDPDIDKFPTLRLAAPLDANVAAKADPVLRDLMTWATTVVHLPRTKDKTAWLSGNIADFPAEFLLFSPHVKTLVLEDRTQGYFRKIELRKSGNELELVDNGAVSRWRVFDRVHHPSEEARADAGEINDRDKALLTWAVPLAGRPLRGRFWAFFPTEWVTTLSGIINAPWKTTSDRQGLQTGGYNEELLREAASLVVDSIPDLCGPEDPGRFLDLLPARAQDAHQWADRLLSEEVYLEAARRPSLPDQEGELQVPVKLHLLDFRGPLTLPSGGPVNAAMTSWAKEPGRPTDWCHSTVYGRERYPRALAITEGAGRSPDHWGAWLEALVDDGKIEDSIAALRTVGILRGEEAIGGTGRAWFWVKLQPEILKAKIILTESNNWVSAAGESVFLPTGYDSRASGVELVHREVANDPEAVAGLETLGVGGSSVLNELRMTLSLEDFSAWKPEDWDRFWILCRRADAREAADVIMETTDELHVAPVRVKTTGGRYMPLKNTLLPGPIVPDDGSYDRDCAVDTRFHADDLQLLGMLGAVDAPQRAAYPDQWAQAEPFFEDYKDDALSAYLRSLSGTGPRPRQTHLNPSGGYCVRPLIPHLALTAHGKTKLTERVLAEFDESDDWVVTHSTLGDTYPTRKVQSYTLWFLLTNGWLETSLGPTRVSACVGPGLGSWSGVLPVARCTDAHAELLGLPNDIDSVPRSRLLGALARADQIESDDLLGGLYGAIAERLPAPELIRCRVGPSREDMAPDEVTVVEDRRQLRVLIDNRTPVLLVLDERERNRLVEEWGLQPTASAIATHSEYVQAGSETTLLEEFSALAWAAPDLADKGYRIVRCTSLREQTVTATDRHSEDVDFLVDDGRLLVHESLSVEDLLRKVDDRFELNLSDADCEAVISNRIEAKQTELVAEIRAVEEDSERIVAAIGEEALRVGMPEDLIPMVEELRGRRLDGGDLGAMAMAVYGIDVLKEFKEAQAEKGLQPPATWAGSTAAEQYVRSLGFPRGFAGWERAGVPPYETVDGPSELPELHDYQRDIADKCKELIDATKERRGLLALPTGAGKTRIAVQALTEAIAEGRLQGPILWVAQTIELCEQAVQSWMDIWRHLGPGRQLRISRLWAANETSRFEGGVQVVVAGIQKLQGCMDKPAYDWLKEMTCLVIDEAHGSTTPEYTRLLNWLGLGRGRGDENCALIGLTATPYRGVSVQETSQLVARYGKKRLDPKISYADLQEKGVIARVKQEVLAGQYSVSLTESELKLLKDTHFLPQRALTQIGLNRDRNLALLEDIMGRTSEEWPILLFAPSVDQARTMAALLVSEGISAASIDANTDAGPRRHFIEKFRAGELRVLANYGVLAQGFDAPSVRTVYIARPTFSPNLYQQMIGRGLRGPLNGGKEWCTVVNVQDNVEQYQGLLAFTEFEYLWKEAGERVDNPDGS
jgi:superfamily II DNA or RNA helicase